MIQPTQASIMESFIYSSNKNKEGPAVARERAMSSALCLTNEYIIRLSKASSNLQLMRISFACRDAQLRNEEAALSAEKAAWDEKKRRNDLNQCYKQSNYDDLSQFDSLDRNSLSSNESNMRKKKIYHHKKRLPAKVEALMRGQFKQLDRSQIGGECGKVDVKRLIKMLESDQRISAIMNTWLKDRNQWQAFIDLLKDWTVPCSSKKLKYNDSNPNNRDLVNSLSNKKATITWGEFLSFFLPGAAFNMKEYRFNNCMLSLPQFVNEISTTAAENMYEVSNLISHHQPNHIIKIEPYIELVLPPKKIENELYLPDLSKMNRFHLKQMIKRLNLERSWLIECIHNICIASPRKNAASISLDICSHRMNSLQRKNEVMVDELKRAKIQIEDLKASFKSSHSKTKEYENEKNDLIKSLNKEMKQMQKQLCACRQDLTDSKEIEFKLKRSLSHAQAKNCEIINEMNALEQKLKATKENAKQQEKLLKDDLVATKNRLESTNEILSMQQNELRTIKADHESLKSDWNNNHGGNLINYDKVNGKDSIFLSCAGEKEDEELNFSTITPLEPPYNINHKVKKNCKEEMRTKDSIIHKLDQLSLLAENLLFDEMKP